jgi:hypothetical protein
MGYTNAIVNPFKFASTSPYYVAGRSVSTYTGSVLNAYSSVNPNFALPTTVGPSRNFTTGDYFTGSNQDGTQSNATYGSYLNVNATTANATSITANNIIISETVAKSLTLTQLETLVAVKGTGVSSDISINPTVLTQANAGLGGKSYLDIPVTWTLQGSTFASHLVVVPDTAKIATDAQTALEAYDANMSTVQANAIHTQADLDNGYTHALGINSNGTTTVATLANSSTLLPALATVNSTQFYTANYIYGTLAITANLNITAGSLQFVSAPTMADFGTKAVSSKTTNIYGQMGATPLSVNDSRPNSLGWSMTVAETSPLTQVDGTGNPVAGGMVLKGDMFMNNGTSATSITSASVLVASSTTGTNGVYNISQNWGATSKTGISLNVPVQQQKVGNYQGTLTWTLNNVPSN